MIVDNIKDTIVLLLKDSPIIKWESKANTIAPIANPIIRPGQTSPSNALAEYLI